MADNPRTYADPMAWWGVIQAGVTEHLTTAELWEKINERAAELGVDGPVGGALGINQVRSIAASLRNASDLLTGAPATDAIVGRYLAPLPYGHTPGQGAGPRLFDVRVNYTAVRGGNPESSYVTLRYTGGLPATVGELRDDAQLVTESLVEGYGASLTDIGAIQIGEL